MRITNAVLNGVGVPITLGTPLADALQPALTILVNTGYTDVQTPSEGGTYNRTYDQSGVYTPFLSQATLTPQEWLQVPGDVVKALIGGITDEIQQIFGVTRCAGQFCARIRQRKPQGLACGTGDFADHLRNRTRPRSIR